MFKVLFHFLLYIYIYIYIYIVCYIYKDKVLNIADRAYVDLRILFKKIYLAHREDYNRYNHSDLALTWE